MFRNFKKTEADLLRIIFGISVLTVFLVSTLFIAVSSQYLLVPEGEKTTSTEQKNLEVQRKSATDKKTREKKVRDTVNQKYGRFSEFNLNLNTLVTLYNEMKANETPEETITAMISQACANQFSNPENAAKCEQTLAIVIKNLKTQYEAETKLSYKEFLIDLMNDLVAAGIVSETLVNDLVVLKTDVEAMITALQNYRENAEEYQDDVVNATKKLLQDTATFMKTYADQEKAIEALCGQTKIQDACAVLIADAIYAYKQYQAGTFDQEEFINMLKNDIRTLGMEKIAELHTQFIAVNTGIINALKAQSEILNNILNENNGSRALNIDAAELSNNLAAVSAAYTLLDTALKTSTGTLTNGVYSKEMVTAITGYAEAVAAIVKTYPKYGWHTDITGHYLRGRLTSTSLKNQIIYANDLDDIVTLSEKYKKIDGTSVHDLIIGENGLLSDIKNSMLPVDSITQEWFTLFDLLRGEELQTAYEAVRRNQNAVNLQLLEIRKTEAEVIREFCTVVRAENTSFCAYSFGTVLKAIAEGSTPKEAICAEAKDPNQCTETWDTFAKAVSETRDNDDPSLSLLIDNLAKNFLSEEQYAELSALIATATEDDALTEEEIKNILKEVTVIMYENGRLEKQAEKAFSSICEDSADVEECIRLIQDLIQLAKDVYNGDKTAEEVMMEIYQELLDDIQSGDTASMTESFEEIESTIEKTLIANEFVTSLMGNRDMSNYNQNLTKDYQYIYGKYVELQNTSDRITEIIVELETATEAEKALLTAELQAQTAKYIGIVVELQAYYLSNYYPNIYAGSYMTLNYLINKNLDRTGITSLHFGDVLNLAAATHPEEDWTAIKDLYSQLTLTTTEAYEAYNSANEAEMKILSSETPTFTMESEKAKDAQKTLNEKMKKIIELKVKLAAELQKMAQTLY